MNKKVILHEILEVMDYQVVLACCVLCINMKRRQGWCLILLDHDIIHFLGRTSFKTNINSFTTALLCSALPELEQGNSGTFS